MRRAAVSAHPHRRLGLGTVQFGLPYGVSNGAGPCPPDEVRRILERAVDAGVDLLDTASQYGDAERVLGEALPRDHRFAIITKTPALSDAAAGADAADRVAAGLHQSLTAMRCEQLDGLLVHDANDLLRRCGPVVWNALESAKRGGLVRKVGVSVYNPGQLEALIDRYPLDIVQLPLNVLDQRLVESGLLTRLKALGVEVHTRSAFSQGLLLMRPDDTRIVSPKAPAAVAAFHAACGDASRIAGALAFPLSVSGIDRVIIGVTSLREFDEILRSAERASELAIDWSSLSQRDDLLINPPAWPDRSGAYALLVGDSVKLRPVTRSDVSGSYLSWLEDPLVHRYLETRFVAQTLDHIAAFVDRVSASDDEHLFAIIRRQDDRHIGNIKLGPINRHHGTAEISFLIGDKTAWGKGYATEAVALTTGLAFRVIGLAKLGAGLYAPNEASRRCFERNGWSREGVLRSQVRYEGGRTDVLRYGITRDEYWEHGG